MLYYFHAVPSWKQLDCQPLVLIGQNHTFDFGYVLYTTLNETQAQSFAGKISVRRKSSKPIVEVYNFSNI